MNRVSDFLLLYDQSSQRWLEFTNPVGVLTAYHLRDVLPALRQVEAATGRGWWAAGFLTYEAAPAFDAALETHTETGGLPLLWFGLYNTPRAVNPPPPAEEAAPLAWQASMDAEAYQQGFERIKRHIGAGETYQVNYTFRLRAPFQGNAHDLFVRAVQAQGGGYPVFVETDAWVIGSASPELFFSLEGERLVSKPMKGTAPRGLWLEDDQAQAEWLRNSEKNRAENVMIVDMVRNDMGRIARTGSVHVPALFQVEKYRTVWQMTSTVVCETSAGLTDILTALFPAASITGAPKARTMQLIRQLETTPRRIYTGTLGYVAPGRRWQFNVAIRTFLLDKATQQVEYGLGGGIVWDSEPRDELREAYRKAQILTAPPPPRFDLLETLLWRPDSGFVLLERHLARMRASAAYFEFPFQEQEIRRKLNATIHYLRTATGEQAQESLLRVRILLSSDGEIHIKHAPLEPLPSPYRVRLAERPVESGYPFLYHKTTHRALYQSLQAAGYDDVLLWNERGELTESTIANLVVLRGGEWLTPPLHCGLLPGTARAEWLAQGKLREAVVRVEDLAECDKMFLLNSVRGLWEITL
ncbi:MAG: aminodeoxychorismate synthase component I [Anaerolineales bacterium]|nr:aminodeoxychorismate synthase component I [Anaerolineales bacterium]